MDQNEGANMKDKLKNLDPRNSLLLDVHSEIHNSSSSDILIKIDENNEPENKSESHSSKKDNSENGEEKVKESSAEGRNFLSPSKDPRLIRSSSLKLEKEKPGTSREKKVSFADAFGFDLTDVRVFPKDEGLPNVPSSAFSDLAACNKPKSKDDFLHESYTFTPQFEQPGSDAYFLEKVKQEKVCLENILIERLKLTGLVRILNIGYEKKVLARYTTNHWISFTDQSAEYVTGSSDELTDKFKFTIHPHYMQPGSNLSLVVKYEVNNVEFWDNNQGKNYTLKCEVKKDPH
ncbi:protein phosphatase 1 regulatory subunit 3A [Trichonephila inaurata madagascariensis]|uniref:Protein phosphatase 1 regulatory subunit 3A n=1 Tax=Trichonephila inaurata madagascariensis TaxID=2747483 RepID=A0A8X6IXH0_9ARAC|nr:protein phosphatase 1 regulatory subunit 3A [Trichonephila inaurata madagascariensis]